MEYCEGTNNANITTNGELEVIRKYIPHCRIVFDVGAHIGEWTQLALKENPQVQIHCFEPSQLIFLRSM